MNTRSMKIIASIIGLMIVVLLSFVFISSTLAQNSDCEIKTRQSSSTESQAIIEIERSTQQYDKMVSDFKVISGKDLMSDNGQKSNMFVYFGRRTCPHCREFVPMLHEVANKNNVIVYYYDTENTNKNPEKQKVRGKLGVEFVPSVVYFKKDGSFEKYNPEK